MGQKLIKNKLILLSLVSILVVSCGSGKSSNTPINMGNRNLPKIRNDFQNKINQNKNDNQDKLVNNVKRESLDKLRKVMNNEKTVREFIFNEQKNSLEMIPTDTRQLNGSTQKIAILDGDFLQNKQRLENTYPGIKILDRVPAGSKNNEKDHGEIVLKGLKEGNNKLNVIAGSIGKSGDDLSVTPRYELYEKILKEFDPKQKVKVFNQSWGTDDTIREARNKSEDYKMSSLAPGSTPEEGRQIFNFYKDVVNNKGGLFIWANGNSMLNKTSEAALQPGLPALYRNDNLEKGWITVVGVQKQRGNEYNIHFEGMSHLAYPGDEAKWWAISADAEIEKDGTRKGSSFAAPRVSKAAALIAEKYDWMTADQVRQTLFTTTDMPETRQKGERSTITSPSYFYGWGMLNQERALKGPGAFIKFHSRGANKDFEANVGDNKVSYFENDIYGDGGLIKQGKGILHLTGNNSYQGGSIVKEGTLEIHKIHSSEIKVEQLGTVTLHSKAIVGYRKPTFYQLIDENEISADKIIPKNLENKGTVKVQGATAIIGGDYIAYPGSKTEIDLSSKIRVLGQINIQDGALILSSDKYIPTGEKAVLMEAADIKTDISSVNINGMRKADTKVTEGKLIAEISRENPLQYIGEKAPISSKNVAENVGKLFEDLDKKILSGEVTKEELVMAGTLQSMPTESFLLASEMMSGEIYASAQALTFSQVQNINRNLSNRLANLNNLKNSEENSEVWLSGLSSSGKLRRNGYASGNTKVGGGQFGLDHKFTSKTTLGMSLNYSHAKANFNRYAGESKSDMIGFSFYGKQDLPYNFYTVARLGISDISTKVERTLLTSRGDTVTANIKHHDKMLSTYAELGKNFNYFTLFVGYAEDYLKRGSFSETVASWGIKAKRKNYKTSNLFVGMRAEYRGDKYRLETYATHAINMNGRDLSYEGRFTGSNIIEKFQGIKLAKNITWLGLGIFKEISPVLGIYGNVDFRIEDKKWADSVFSTGLQYKF